MRRDIRHHIADLGYVVAFYIGLVWSANSGFALNESNPYTAIGGRNVFALKPPTPTSTVNTPPPVPPAGIELQGFTTILGRPQVLLKVKMPPKPPEPAKDRSLVMDVGQREGEVEVVEMDAYAGTVKIKNQGNLIPLNLKDNATKPTAGPALPPPVPAALPPHGNIAPPASGTGGAATPAGTGIPLPTRSLRTDSAGSAGDAGNPYSRGTGQSASSSPEATMQKIEANVALYEANRIKNEDLIKAGAKIPRMPQHTFLREASGNNP